MIKLEMTRKQEMILAALIVLAALAAFVFYTGILNRPEPEPEPEPEPTLLDIIAEDSENITYIYHDYLALLDEDEYTLDNPLVIVNPFGTSPLTALVLFTTEELSQISVRINGKTEDASIYQTFEGFDTVHAIPVYGLYPASSNLVDIAAQPEDAPGGVRYPHTQLIIDTPPLPGHFPEQLIVQPPVPGDILFTGEQPEMHFTFMNNLRAYDDYGDCRWFYQGYGTLYPSGYNEKGNILIIAGSFDDNSAILLEIDLLGRIVSYQPAGPDDELEFSGQHHIDMRTLYHP